MFVFAAAASLVIATEILRAIIADLQASQVVDIVARSDSGEGLKALLDQGRVHLGILIPPDFERRVQQRERNAVQLLVDGSEPETIRAILEVEIDNKEHQDIQAAKVYDGMGGYSPTIGIIGAVMGLIHVMNNLADPSKLGSGIATAFVATIYGVGFANLLFLPMANKLKSQVHSQTQFREMIVEGVISIAEGENPRNIETKLQGFYQ